MSIVEKVRRSNFYIKVTSWEYWPFGFVQFPLFIYFSWLAIRSRSLLFFSASNPAIAMGGMFGESKYEVLKKIPGQYIPKTILIAANTSRQYVLEAIAKNNFQFPVIFKPDVGERGFMVKKIKSEHDIDSYIAQLPFPFLVQEFVDRPLEFSIFYTRFPQDNEGKVTSVVLKEMLNVVGNGRSTLQELILAKDRAKLQWNTLKITYHGRLEEILPNEETLELVSIGNHCLGTMFLDASHLINSKLSEVFDAISKQIDGFYFGRYDLRCNTNDDLYEGKIKVMELNGCGAEPSHIYQPGFPLGKAFGVLFNHWQNIFTIAQQNVKNGATYTSLQDGLHYYNKFKMSTQIKK